MTPDLTALALIALPLSLLCQWWLMRKRWMTRVHQAQARHARYQARAEMLFDITKQRMAGLRRQMQGQPANLPKPPKPPKPDMNIRPGAQSLEARLSEHVEFELIVVDHDGSSASA